MRYTSMTLPPVIWPSSEKNPLGGFYDPSYTVEWALWVDDDWKYATLWWSMEMVGYWSNEWISGWFNLELDFIEKDISQFQAWFEKQTPDVKWKVQAACRDMLSSEASCKVSANAELQFPAHDLPKFLQAIDAQWVTLNAELGAIIDYKDGVNPYATVESLIELPSTGFTNPYISLKAWLLDEPYGTDFNTWWRWENWGMKISLVLK